MWAKILLVFGAILIILSVDGQSRLYIKSVNIDYDVRDTERVFDMKTTYVFKNPRIKLDVAILNNTVDTLRFNTDNSILRGNIQYEFNGELISIGNAGLMTSNDPISVPFVLIPPNDAYQFFLSFEPLPASDFSFENYHESVFLLLSTLRIIIKQDQPQQIEFLSEPICCKGITIQNGCEPMTLRNLTD